MNDLVWKVILPMDKRNKAFGKWAPGWEGPWNILRVFSNNAYEIKELNDENRIMRINGKYLKKYNPLLEEVSEGEKNTGRRGGGLNCVSFFFVSPTDVTVQKQMKISF